MLMLSSNIISRLEGLFPKGFILNSTHAIGGGSINQAALIHTNQGKYFIKWNKAASYPQMFEKEAQTLILLAKTRCLRIPEVEYVSEEGAESFLVLEYIEEGRSAGNFWKDFAFGLAELHRNTQEQFGLSFDNYIGSLSQSNHLHNDWIEFFVEERLLPQIKLARDASILSQPHIRAFERLFIRLDDIFPMEKPALLHGDLWSGNFLVGQEAKACIFDPAIYYGSRMMDIAMTQMFGGFAPEFYQYYNDSFPFEKNISG